MEVVTLASAPMHSAAMPRTHPSVWRLAARQTLRDLRAGELRLLFVAVMLAVASLTAVGFFADRLNRGLARDAQQMLGGDAVVVGDDPLPAEFATEARSRGLRTATTDGFPSMARAPDDRGGASRLVGVKAVDAGYPLLGALRVRTAGDPGSALSPLKTQSPSQSPSAAPAPPAAPAPSKAAAPAALVRHGPAPGTVWVDPGVLEALGLQLNDTLLLGDARLRIAGVIEVEPDRGVGFTGFSPRVMLAAADLPATGLVQPTSRVNYRLAVAANDHNADHNADKNASSDASNDASDNAGDDRAVRSFVAWVQARIQATGVHGVRVETLDEGRPEMRQTLDRAQKFLNLVALLAALLAAVAVSVAARDFAARRQDDCAMLRVLGVPQRRIALQYVLGFALVGLLASAAGVLLGLAVQGVFIRLLSGLIASSLPPPGAWPAVFGVGVGAALLFGFAVPPVLQLARVPPLRVMRRDLGPPKASALIALAAGVVAFGGLLLGASSDLELGGLVVGGFAGALVLFALAGYAALRLLRRAVPESGAPRWLALATRQLAARPAFAVLQIASLSVGLLALVLLVLLRTDLISSWRSTLPPDAADRFVINVQPEQGGAFQAQLRAGGVKAYDWYPMIRGRLVGINGKDPVPIVRDEPAARRMVDREFNLSHAGALPPHNAVVAGAWRPDEPGGLSVEEGLAKTLHLKLGDRLTFDVAGTPAEGRITSLRKVDWGSMRVNFFVLFPTAQLPQDLPASYIAAYRSPGGGFDNGLVRAFPNITDIDISNSMAQVQRVLDQVTQAVEFLFTFTLAAGLLVLFAAVTATREARARDYAVMRALGASATLLAQVQRAELLGTGALAGVMASLAAMAVGWALAHYVFNFEWTASALVPLVGGAAGAALAWAAGWWTLRDLLRRPVTETLRRAAV